MSILKIVEYGSPVLREKSKEVTKISKKIKTLITDMLAKISTLKTHIEKHNLEIDIQVDGGINLKTADRVKDAGANILVAGTAILMASDYKVIIDELKK